jgi:hypothetical protein
LFLVLNTLEYLTICVAALAIGYKLITTLKGIIMNADIIINKSKLAMGLVSAASVIRALASISLAIILAISDKPDSVIGKSEYSYSM